MSYSTTEIVLYARDLTAYIVLPFLFVWIAARPTVGTVKDFFWPKEADGRLAALAFWLPLALPIPVTLVLRSDLPAIWSMSAVSLLPVVLLSSERIILPRNAVAAIVSLATVLPVVALIVAPGIAIANYLRGGGYYAGPYRLLAQEIERNWREVTNQPLRLVGGHLSLADGATFYLSDKPSSVNLFHRRRSPWADDARIKREGIALVCPASKQSCLDKLEAFARAAPKARRVDVTLVRRYLGLEDLPDHYTLLLIAPELPDSQ